MKMKFTVLIFFSLCMASGSLFGQEILKSLSRFRNPSKPKEAVKAKADTSKSDLGGFGNFVFNNATPIQSLNILADLSSAINSSKTSIFGLSSKFYGLQKASTIKQDSIGLALLIPENSLWGINLTPNIVFSKSKVNSEQADLALGFAVKIDYASKKFNTKDSVGNVKSTFQIGQFLVRPGIEIAFRGKIGLYYNLNWNATSTGIEDFRKVFNNTPVLNYTYSDFGVRGRYTLSNGSTSLNLDINFIALNDNLRILYKSSDKVIPLIRLGFSQSFIFK